ncbi:helix-turn-helix domain-containing protein [Devriesea agamarum]|uniref:helix-turn-helix domain-containing protein n=1 Tax=Devriesea agamarum TaxID=472569 RepID=UPI00071CAD62|nr:helix-turn-helix transcriptional regulator [Devriesea agamarum]
MPNNLTEGTIPNFTKADRLRKARELLGLDQSAMAIRLGVSRGTVSNAERGAVEPRRTVVLAWALVTGVSLHWLETGKEAPEDD